MYLKDAINDLKESDTWKIQLAIAITSNYFSSKDNDEYPAMHSKSYNIEFMIYDNADEVVEELFQSLFSRDQTRLETSKRDSGLSFYCVNLLYYKNYKID